MEFGFATKPFAITPSDTAILTTPTVAISVSTPGTLRYRTPDGNDITVPVTAGLHAVAALMVFATGTTAAGLAGFAAGGYRSPRWRRVLLNSIPDWTTFGFSPSDILSYERSVEGEWRANYHLRQQLPSDWRTFNKIFVDPVLGSDAFTGATFDAAKRSLHAAISASQSPGNHLILVSDGAQFSYGAGNGPSSNVDKQSPGSTGAKIVIMPIGVWRQDGEGDARWTSSTKIATAVSNAPADSPILVLTLKTDAAAPDPNNSFTNRDFGMVYDRRLRDEFGLPQTYVKAASIANVAQVPYSYFYENATRQMTINVGRAADSAVPDIDVYLADAANGYAESGGRKLYVVNGDFVGGKPFILLGITGGAKLRMYGCTFSQSGDRNRGFVLEGTDSGTVDIGFYRCEAYHNGFDGISYYANCNFAEIECRSYRNGLTGEASSRNLVNGFTTHFVARGVRVACVAHDNSGPNLADSAFFGGSAALNLGCRAFNSRGNPTVNFYSVDFTVNSSTTATQSPRMWLIDPKWESPDGIASRSRIQLRMDNDQVSGPNRPRLYVNDVLPARMGYNGGAAETDVVRMAPTLG